MKIEIIGGGPGGLYFALLMKKRFPDHDVTVHERNRPDDTFGFGVVFSDETLDNLMDYDPESYAAITRDRKGRRINLADPDQSLLLRKPLGEISHGGGRLLARGTPEHRILRAWLAAGAPAPRASDPRPVRLEVSPPLLSFVYHAEHFPSRVVRPLGARASRPLRFRHADGMIPLANPGADASRALDVAVERRGRIGRPGWYHAADLRRKHPHHAGLQPARVALPPSIAGRGCGRTGRRVAGLSWPRAVARRG